MKGAALLLLAGCAAACESSSQGPIFPTSERFPDAPRRPPSFAAEPAFNARSSAVVATEPAALSEPSPVRREVAPLDAEQAHELVGRFFIAVLEESTRQLFPLFSAQATVLSEGNRQPAQAVWRARFAQLDYTSLTGRLVAPPQTLRTYTFASSARAKRDGVPAPTSATEVVVIARPSGALIAGGKARLFGEALAFRLRPRADTRVFEIAEIIEDFRLP